MYGNLIFKGFDLEHGKLKTIIKTEKKRKREDEEDDKKDMDIVKKIGKKVKKEARGGKLKHSLKALQSAEPTKSKYIVVTVEFYQDFY